MLVVFSPIFVADTKIIFRYDFVAPLKNSQNSQENKCAGVSFLMKFQACNFIKKETGTGAFLLIL